MKVTFLGTGTSQGIPIISCDCKVCASTDSKDKRLRTSIMIEKDDVVIIIDAGPDFRYQMLRQNVKRIDAVLITHGHKDHTGGLDDVRAFNYFMKKPVDVYSSLEVQKVIRNDYVYAFAANKYPGVPEITLHTVTNEPFNICGIDITPIEVMHYKMHVFGYRIGDFTYITDANYISEDEMKKITGSKTLVINALRRKQHVSHFTLEQALEIIKKLNPEVAYLTHISHQLGLHEEVEKELPANVHMAYDGLSIEIL